VALAVVELASDAKVATAIDLGRRCSSSWAEEIGVPTKIRFSEEYTGEKLPLHLGLPRGLAVGSQRPSAELCARPER
jgi:hypothetical protein